MEMSLADATDSKYGKRDRHTIVYPTINSKKFVRCKVQVEEILGGLATLVPLSLVRHLFTPTQVNTSFHKTQVIISVLKLKLRLLKLEF